MMLINAAGYDDDHDNENDNEYMMLVVFHELADSITSVEGKKGLNTRSAHHLSLERKNLRFQVARYYRDLN